MPITRKKSKVKAKAVSSKSELKVNDQPDTGTANVELETTNVNIKEPEAIVLDDEEQSNKVGIEVKQIYESDIKQAGGGSHHEEDKRGTIETRVEVETANDLNNGGEIDANNCKGNEENAKELRNEACAGSNMNVDSGENAEKVRNEEEEMSNIEHNKENFTASEDMQNKDVASVSEQSIDEVLVVSKNGFKEESLVGNLPDQNLGKAKGLCTGSLSKATAINEEEENKNDDANIASKVVFVPKKKILKPKKIIKKKKKLVKGKSVVAKDECNPQLSEMHDPVAEVRTNENVKNEVNNSSTVTVKEKNTHQHTDKVVLRDDKKPEQSKKTKLAGKGKEAFESENVGEMKEEAKSESGIKKLNKRKRREVEKGNIDDRTTKDKDKAEPSEKGKSLNKVGEAGMIFMCSSKTKDDCYRYKIFGLPANKKDVVSKVYDGMRLFLFDFDLKLLYGIYKAAGPGGYDIEPNAFKSKFPSQVRFTVVHDCLPVGEEKFKKVIKDNYYTKNKFSCELNSEQVKNLCKLFHESSKGAKAEAKAKAVLESSRVRAPPVVERAKKKRARNENNLDQARKKRKAEIDARDSRRRVIINEAKASRARADARPLQSGDYARRSRAKGDARRSRAEDIARRSRAKGDARRTRAEADARRLRAEDDARRSPRTVDSRQQPWHADVYDPYIPAPLPVTRHQVALPPAEIPTYAPSYTYGRTSVLDEYRRDLGVEHQDRGLAYSRPQLLHEYDPLDRYLSHREPAVYRDPGYTASTSIRQNYYPPIASGDEYLSSASRAFRYLDPRSPYRRY